MRQFETKEASTILSRFKALYPDRRFPLPDDVLPATDYGIQKGFAGVYRKGEMPSPKEILEYGEKWRPFRTTASLYLWRAVDTGLAARD